MHKLQDKFSIAPLSSYGKPYTPVPGAVDPSFDMKTAVRDQVDAMSAADFFKYLAQLLQTNPPAAADAPIVGKMKSIGLVPGQDFDPSKLAAFDSQSIQGIPKQANAKIMAYFPDAGKSLNGWVYFVETGLYGADYLDRAFITAVGVGANRPQDAIYPPRKKT